MTVTRGSVSRRSWIYQGKRRSTWQYSFKVDGRQVRRQGFLSRAESQEALDAARERALHPDSPTPTVVSLTLAEAFTRYFEVKARKRSLAENQRIAKHLKAEFGERTRWPS